MRTKELRVMQIAGGLVLGAAAAAIGAFAAPETAPDTPSEQTSPAAPNQTQPSSTPAQTPNQTQTEEQTTPSEQPDPTPDPEPDPEPQPAGTVSLSVKDNRGNVLRAMEFVLTDASGQAVSFVSGRVDAGPYTFTEEGGTTQCFSDKSGLIQLRNVPVGTYTLMYSGNDNAYYVQAPVTLRVQPNQTIKTDISLRRDAGRASIRLTGPKGEAISGSVFWVMKDSGGSAEFAKEGNSYVEATGGTKEIATDSKGLISISELPVGSYTLRQIKKPEKYNGEYLESRFNIDREEETIITLANEIRTGALHIQIQDDQSRTLTGGEYVLCDPNGVRLHFTAGSDDAFDLTEEASGSQTIRTGSSGQIVLRGLQEGNYTFEEVKSPAGYEKMPKQNVVILADQTAELAVSKQMSVGKASIQAMDSVAGKKVGGCSFSLSNADNQELSFELTGKNTYALSDEGTVKVLESASGDLQLTGLPKGTYFIRQKKAPSGFNVSPNTMELKIEAGKTAKLEISVPRANTSLLVRREDGKPAVGITIHLQDVNGARVFTAQSADSGRLLISGVRAGTYTWVTSSLPSPYLNKEQQGTFEITAEGEMKGTTEIRLPLNQVTVQSAPVAGAVFQLSGVDDPSIVLTATTNDAGVATFTGMEDGKYALIQLREADGYSKSPETLSVELVRGTSDPLAFEMPVTAISQEAKDKEKDAEEEENRGKKDNTAWMILYAGLGGLALIGSALAVYFHVGKKNKKAEPVLPLVEEGVPRPHPEAFYEAVYEEEDPSDLDEQVQAADDGGETEAENPENPETESETEESATDQTLPASEADNSSMDLATETEEPGLEAPLPAKDDELTTEYDESVAENDEPVTENDAIDDREQDDIEDSAEEDIVLSESPEEAEVPAEKDMIFLEDASDLFD